MPSFADAALSTFDGLDAAALASLLGVPRVLSFDALPSTMDVAHAAAAAGSPAGTLVVADAQTAGRGRAGRPWASAPGAGLWITLVERPTDAEAIDVLSLRLGLRAARAVEPFSDDVVRVKWPNDLYVVGGKLAGILVEARWRDSRPEWVAVGVGMNVRAPADVPHAAGLRSGVRRLDVLRALIPALRGAAAAKGPLTAAELAEYAARDLALGRRIEAPAHGTVRGVTATGELSVERDDGRVEAIRHGSLVFAGAEGAQ